MIFTGKQLHETLLHLPGKHKELFIERQTGVGLKIVNGRIEPVTHSETSGISLLLTHENERFFQTGESFESFDSLIATAKVFDAPCGKMAWSPKEETYTFSDKEILEHLGLLRDRILPHVEKLQKIDWITSTMIGVGISERSYVALSETHSGGMDSQYQIRVFALVIGKKGELTQEYYDTLTANNCIENFSEERITNLFDTIVARLESLLSAPPAPSGEMDIVIATEAGGVIIHEAIGHGLEGDAQASSIYAGKIGQMVASSKVTVIDDPTLEGLRGSYELDHEGVPAERAVLIENGILKNYLHQKSSAEHLDLPHNGHARRESYIHESIVRMGNTYLDNGPDSREDIIASVQDGLYVTAIGGGQVNTVSGDFVFKINYAQRIRNGKIEEVVRSANLAGNGPKMLADISMVGNDLVIGKNAVFIGGTCGKDGQGMPVTDANPTIKVRLKVTG